eukprot:6710184-Pyramimonas_sp.AAC.1
MDRKRERERERERVPRPCCGASLQFRRRYCGVPPGGRWHELRPVVGGMSLMAWAELELENCMPILKFPAMSWLDLQCIHISSRNNTR